MNNTQTLKMQTCEYWFIEIWKTLKITKKDKQEQTVDDMTGMRGGEREQRREK